MTPILLIGAGRMGSAMIEGWMSVGAFPPEQIMVRDPVPPLNLNKGCRINPPDEDLRAAKTVVVAVKPQIWATVAQSLVGFLSEDAVIVSIAAGISIDALALVFGSRPIARVMPTTAVGAAQGTASLYSASDVALQTAHALFDPIATTVELLAEHDMHAATAVSGSAPAYLYAFVEALEAAGIQAGLSPDQASRLARSTIAGSARLLEGPSNDPGNLRRAVTSPGGTTEAALGVLMADQGFPALLEAAVGACIKRSIELGKL
jgi:pyrroline-5-carboxylate reductase